MRHSQNPGTARRLRRVLQDRVAKCEGRCHDAQKEKGNQTPNEKQLSAAWRSCWRGEGSSRRIIVVGLNRRESGGYGDCKEGDGGWLEREGLGRMKWRGAEA